ncbi:MAG: hypothetical protein HYT73_02745 [Candidatus Aenigmarchaeota archaeon]|nr:hypothetical protein [Candidatus Aenigmarchaeota archaeon]
MTEATAAVETGESGISEMGLYDEGPDTISPVFVGKPTFTEQPVVKRPAGAEIRNPPSLGPYGFTEEERGFVLGLQNERIATEKFFESFITGDVGTPYTVREMLAKGRRPEVQEYLIVRYLFDNGIYDEHGELPVVGEVRRYMAKKKGGIVREGDFSYANLERYCRESGLSETAADRILGTAVMMFATKPGFY